MVEFAGWSLPVQYPAGIMAEHRHCRSAAALFDVSHMGQVLVRGAAAAAEFERLVPADVAGLPEGRLRYTVFTNEARRGARRSDRRQGRGWPVRGGQRRPPGRPTSPTCAGALEPACTVEELAARALLALQGPAAAAVMARLAPARPGSRSCRRPRSRSRAALPRLPLRLHRRGRLRDLGRRRARPRSSRAACSRSRRSRPPASAPAIRCASRPGSASTATSSRRRPARSRPGSPGPSPSAGAPKAAFRAPA